MNVAQQTAETNSAAHHARAGLGSTLFRVAWLAILLGIAMEALLLLFTAGFEILPGLGPMVAELIGKVSWSAIVCAGLALGTAASKARAIHGTSGVPLCPPRLPHFSHPSAGSSQDSRSCCCGRSRRQLHLDTTGPPQGDRVRVPRCDYRMGRTTTVGRGAGTRGSGACRGNTLRRGDRKLHVLDGSGATGRSRPLLPQCERDPLPRGLLSCSVLRNGFGGASRAMRQRHLGKRAVFRRAASHRTAHERGEREGELSNEPIRLLRDWLGAFF